MRRIVLALITLIVLVSACSTKKANYYRKVDFDDSHRIVGYYPLSDKVGLASTCYNFIYDKKHRLSQIRFLSNGKPAEGEILGFSVASIDITYGEDYFEISAKDLQGKSAPVESKVKRLIYAMDLFLQMLEKKKVTLPRSCYYYKIETDKKGFPQKTYFYDEDRKLTRDFEGVSHYDFTKDDKGRLISIRNFDEGGKAITNVNGVFEKKIKYDNKTRTTWITHYNKDSKVFQDSLNVASQKIVYDKNNNIIELSYYGEHEQLVEHKDYEYATEKKIYDDQGLLVEHHFFGSDAQPTHVSKTTAIIKYKYDPQGNSIEERYFDGSVKPIEKDGVACEKYVYDEDGNRIETALYDSTEKPCKGESPAFVKKKFDKKRNEIEVMNLNHANQFKEDGFFYVKRMAYDNQNRLIVETYFRDSVEKGIYNSSLEKYHKKTCSYSEDGKVTTTRYYDIDGKPARLKFLSFLEDIYYSYTTFDGDITKYMDSKGNVVEETSVTDAIATILSGSL